MGQETTPSAHSRQRGSCHHPDPSRFFTGKEARTTWLDGGITKGEMRLVIQDVILEPDVPSSPSIAKARKFASGSLVLFTSSHRC